LEFLRWTSIPTQMSNFYCHPGIAGGLPTGFMATGSNLQLSSGHRRRKISDEEMNLNPAVTP
jgi:hypothetical protein